MMLPLGWSIGDWLEFIWARLIEYYNALAALMKKLDERHEEYTDRFAEHDNDIADLKAEGDRSRENLRGIYDRLRELEKKNAP